MIEDVKTGERIATTVEPVGRDDLRSLGRGWRFKWIDVVRTTEVFKLIAPAAPNRVLGLVALKRYESYIKITYLESNPNDVGPTKNYRGIAGSLLAFAAQLSFEIGAEGFIALNAKTELIDHYRETYGFERVGKSQRMLLGTRAAADLIKRYGGRPIHE